MSYFKNLFNGLLSGLKGNNKEAPFYYWEEYSCMSALVPENYSLTEEVFVNIEALDGIKIKYKKLPHKKTAGKLVISYERKDFEVGFFLGDFPVHEMRHWEQQYFTEENKEKISSVKKSLNIFMKFEGKSQKCYHLQLKLIYAMVPEMVALFDESAKKLLNKKWVELAVKSNLLPDPINLFRIHAVYDKNEVWLYSYGLCRCNLREIEILGSNMEDSVTHYELLSNYASWLLNGKDAILIDETNEQGEETLPVGFFYDEEPIVVSSKKWTNGLKYYPKDILGGFDDRKNSHNSKTNIIFLYGCEEDYNKKRLRKPSEFTEKLENESIYFVSDDETKRKSSLARERFSYVERMLKEKQEGKEDIDFIIKLGLETIDENGNIDTENREHIWFEDISMEGDSIKGKVTQEPYNIPNLHEGDEGICSKDYVSDWKIHTEKGIITPETVYLLDL